MPSIFDLEHVELLRWHRKWAVAAVPTTPRIALADGLAALSASPAGTTPPGAARAWASSSGV